MGGMVYLDEKKCLKTCPKDTIHDTIKKECIRTDCKDELVYPTKAQCLKDCPPETTKTIDSKKCLDSCSQVNSGTISCFADFKFEIGEILKEKGMIKVELLPTDYEVSETGGMPNLHI